MCTASVPVKKPGLTVQSSPDKVQMQSWLAVYAVWLVTSRESVFLYSDYSTKWNS